MKAELFLEIGTEEIPAGMIRPALADLSQKLAGLLDSSRVPAGEIVTHGTPRRLVVSARGVPVRQADREVEVKGPPARIAFDAEGRPTKAAAGFARGQGAPVEALVALDIGGERFAGLKRTETGRDTAAILAEALPGLIGSLAFRKSMRWGGLDAAFVRPVHWMVAVFDGRVVPFSFAGVASGVESRGHRFLAPGPFPVTGLDDYLAACAAAWVVPAIEDRRRMVAEGAAGLLPSSGIDGELVLPEELLETIANLVEHPFPVLGRFDPAYLAIPEEVLTTTMQSHQKYIPIRDRVSGRLLPVFVATLNNRVADPGLVARGNERVLRARLDDARFYYTGDRDRGLPAMVDDLKHVVFQEKLGTSYEKMERFAALAAMIAGRLGFDGFGLEHVGRAARLCKGDLVSGTVGQFPELQGVMGRYFALHHGEPPEVADAIRDHYRPAFAGDRVPDGDVSAIVGLADRLDTVCGCIGAGLKPSGSADPFALRRAAIAALNIVIEKGYRLDLGAVVRQACIQIEPKTGREAGQCAAETLDFIGDRLRFMLRERFPADVVEAVLGAAWDADPAGAVRRTEALAAVTKEEWWPAVAVGFKRVVNIQKKLAIEAEFAPDRSGQQAELALAEAAAGARVALDDLIGRDGFEAAFRALSGLRPAIDRYFDEVMVMCADDAERNNHLALLRDIARDFGRLADFSKLAG